MGSEAAQSKLEKARAIAAAKVSGQKKKPKSGFSRDIADVSNKNVKRTRFTAHKDRKADTKGRGAKKGGPKAGKVGRQGKGGKVGKRK